MNKNKTMYWDALAETLAPNQREQLAKALLWLIRRSIESHVSVIGDGTRIVRIVRSEGEPFERPAESSHETM
jgi:hypothetical protein